MAKIKYTKSELKNQRDALSRFSKFLPILELKRQQLQIEVQHVQALLETKKIEELACLEEVESYIRLFADNIDLSRYIKVKAIKLKNRNIAGVAIPVLEEVIIERAAPDLFETPTWLDEGLDITEKLIKLRAEQNILHEQEKLLREELLITTQRVNLFEKVKIPEGMENIRVIRIFLGDQDTAGVVRAKIAKKKSALVSTL